MSEEVSVEAQQYAEQFESQFKRKLNIYWISLIPILMGPYFLDRILSLIFKANFSPFNEVAPYFPLWVAVCFLTFPFVLAWTWLYWTRGSSITKTILSIIWIAFLCVMGYFSEATTPERLGLNPISFNLILDALILVLILGTFILSALARTLITKLILIISYIIAFVIVHWVFYLPMFPDFTWSGINTSWAATTNQPIMSQLAPTIMAGVALVMIVVMLVLSSKSIRRKLVVHEVIEQRSKHR